MPFVLEVQLLRSLSIVFFHAAIGFHVDQALQGMQTEHSRFSMPRPPTTAAVRATTAGCACQGTAGGGCGVWVYVVHSKRNETP